MTKNTTFKIGILSASCMITLLSWGNDTRKILQAIESSDVQKVKKLVKKLTTTGMSRDELYHLYGPLYDRAAEIVDEKTSQIGYFGSILDIAQSTFGSLMTGAGLVVFTYAQLLSPQGDSEDWTDGEFALNNKLWQIKFGAGALGLLGSYLAYRGMSCSTQKGWLKPAQEIEAYCEKLFHDAAPQEQAVQEQQT